MLVSKAGSGQPSSLRVRVEAGGIFQLEPTPAPIIAPVRAQIPARADCCAQTGQACGSTAAAELGEARGDRDGGAGAGFVFMGGD